MPEDKRKRVLVVEDTDVVQVMMKRWVTNAGYDVETASDGAEALEKAKAVTPDIILLDVVMPKLNGFAVCRELRKLEHTKKTPIIIVTGLRSEADSEEGRKCGANEILIKPVDGKDLVARIRHYTGSIFK
ncbi:MAG TPA: response regulator transcription factor [Bacteroidota bacterium]|nr:response regulator transcription factor [Bacteroidota bacterium]